jgi:excisionase family DNA binding protein
VPSRKPYLTTGDIANQIGVTRTTVLHWIKAGKLHAALMTPGGHYRVSPKDLEDFMNGHSADPTRSAPRHKILVVDDDPAILDIVVRALRPVMPNAMFETASDGVDAGMKLLRFRPDLLILDLFLPGIDGFEVCRLVRGDPELKGVAILCVTGYNQPGMRERAQEAGANECLFKPLDMGMLRERARTLLGMAAE